VSEVKDNEWLSVRPVFGRWIARGAVPTGQSVHREAVRRELRNFGLLLGVLFVAVFCLVPWLTRRVVHVWPVALALVLWTGAIARPQLLGPLHAGWTRLGHILGWVNTRVILTVVFFLMIVPIGLIMRMFGRDPMARQFEAERESYRVPSRSRGRESLEHPY
jgi:hypothetical protein